MGQAEARRLQHNLGGERSLLERGRRFRDPLHNVTAQGYAALFYQQNQLPDADGGEPDLVSLVLQRPSNPRGELLRGDLAPNSEVGVQK